MSYAARNKLVTFVHLVHPTKTLPHTQALELNKLLNEYEAEAEANANKIVNNRLSVIQKIILSEDDLLLDAFHVIKEATVQTVFEDAGLKSLAEAATKWIERYDSQLHLSQVQAVKTETKVEDGTGNEEPERVETGTETIREETLA